MHRGGYFSRVLDGQDRSTEAHVLVMAVAIAAVCVFQAWAMHKGQPLDMVAFGGTLVGIITGGAGVAAGQGYLVGRSASTLPTAHPVDPDKL